MSNNVTSVGQQSIRWGDANDEEDTFTRRQYWGPASRRSDPETSHQAAASVGNITSIEVLILAAFAQFGPMTDDELAGHLDGCHPPTVKTCRSRLTQERAVEPTLERRLSNRRRQQIVWRLA